MPARRTAAVGSHTDSSSAPVASDSVRERVKLAKHLRQIVDRMHPESSLTITRDVLLGLTAVGSCGSEQPVSRPDLTGAEWGGRFHRSPSTIRDWCEHGRFEGAYKLNGRDWRISQAAVDAFLARQRRQPQDPLVRLSAWRATRHRAP
jgi:hypothetical protein